MSKENLVSIIIPVYNAEKYLKYTLASILRQSYKNWEVIIVNDFSNDYSDKIIKQFINKVKNIKYIKNDKNKGVSVSRNRAIQEAQGRYIAFLDSDDIWHKDKLRLQLSFMNKYNADFSFTSYQFIDSNNKKINKFITPPLKLNYIQELKENFIGCSTVIIDTKKMIKEDINFIEQKHEDYILWLSLLKKGYKGMGLKRVLGFYRISDKSISSNKYNAASWRWNIYRNIEHLSLFHSIYYFLVYSYRAFIKHYLKISR